MPNAFPIQSTSRHSVPATFEDIQPEISQILWVESIISGQKYPDGYSICLSACTYVIEI